jgi:pimeloyl-ACP methyl ester carboxylesterase
MVLDTLEAISIGGVTQWMRIRSHDRANPVLVLIQQGPGLPMINEVSSFERTLHLEEHFTVVYWDQRGCGLSLRRPKSATRLDLALLVSDTVELLELLYVQFGSPSFIAGFSIGATIGAMAANTRPELVTALIGVGMDINGPQAEAHAYSFALETATQRRHKRAQRQLKRIGAGPHTTFKQLVPKVTSTSLEGALPMRRATSRGTSGPP